MNVPRIGGFQVGVANLPAHNAFPYHTAVPTQAGLQFVSAGGLTKLEWMAAQFIAQGATPERAIASAMELLELCSRIPVNGNSPQA